VSVVFPLPEEAAPINIWAFIWFINLS